LIGVNASTYSTIAALLASRPRTSIESIKLFDIGGQREAHVIVHDLQSVASLNKTKTRLEWVQSFWETKDSTIIVILVQHHRLGECH
jgi:malate/lactate dehydrogenase